MQTVHEYLNASQAKADRQRAVFRRGGAGRAKEHLSPTPALSPQ